MKNTNMIIALFTFVCLGSIHAQYGRTADPCNPTFSDDVNVTIFGDSLGDFADNVLYGYFGWAWYLRTGRPDTDWKVQNLAVGGADSLGVYNSLTDCGKTPGKRNSFRTANNVAVEMGGNDFVHNIANLTFFPWMFPRIEAATNQNTRLMIEALLHKRRKKNVLLLGTPAAITNSPTMGPGKNFQWFARQPSGQIRSGVDLVKRARQESRCDTFDFFSDWAGEIPTSVPTEINDPSNYANECDQGDAALVFIYSLVEFTGNILSFVINDIIFNSLNELISLFDINLNLHVGHQRHACGFILPWYCEWVQANVDSNYTHGVAVALLLHQGSMARIAQNAGVPFLPFYPATINHKDCTEFGQCMVGNRKIYSDVIHFNHLGYALWGKVMGDKFVELGWHNSRGGGTIANPNAGEPGDPDGVVVPKSPSLGDLAIYCLFIPRCNPFD